MRYVLVTKRYYTNRDLIADRFGRLYHLPAHLSRHGHDGLVLALDYRRGADAIAAGDTAPMVRSLPVRRLGPLGTWRTLCHAVRAHTPDVVIASGDTPLGAAGRRLARLTGAAFAFDVYDDYRTFASARLPGMKRLFRRTLAAADLAIFASEAFAAEMRTASSLRRWAVVPNGYDPAVFRPQPRAACRAAFGLPECGVLIGYFGSLGWERGTDVLMAAAERLAGEIPGLALVLAGHPAAAVPGGGRVPVHFLGSVDQQAVAQLIGACDLVSIPYRQTAYTQATQACKIAEYLACRVPVAATRVGQATTALADIPQALCRPDDADDLARVLKAQIAAPVLAPVPTELAWETLAGRLEAELGGVLASRRS